MRVSPRAFINSCPRRPPCDSGLAAHVLTEVCPSLSHFIVPVTAFLTSLASASCTMAFSHRTSVIVVHKSHLS